MKLVWHSYLIFSLDNNCVHTISTEIALLLQRLSLILTISAAGTTAAMSWNTCLGGGEHSRLSTDPTLAKGILSFLSPPHHSKPAIS